MHEYLEKGENTEESHDLTRGADDDYCDKYLSQHRRYSCLRTNMISKEFNSP